MSKLKILGDNFIHFDEDPHTYTGKDRMNYESVSRVIRHVKEPFDTERISYFVARKELRQDLETFEVEERLIKIRQEEIKMEWKRKAEDAANYGTNIHKYLEDYFNGKKVDKRSKLYPLALALREYYLSIGYHAAINEAILYSREHLVAGTTDRVHLRTRNASVLDFFDYKTNIEKGIVFDSAKREENVLIKHYNRYLLSPLEHLEACNYTEYALQLSIYALMATLTYGCKIGRLVILFIDKDYTFKPIPVPFMKYEAEKMLQLNNEKKALISTSDEPDDDDDF